MEFNETAKRLEVVLATEALCAEKPLKQVSIGEICEKAGISKSGFYRLFHDKYEIAFWAQSIVSKRGVDNMGRTLGIAEGVAITLKGIAIFGRLYLEAANSGEFVTADELARRDFSGILRETVRDFHGQPIDAELGFMIDWFSAMGREFAKGWLSGEGDGEGGGITVERAAAIFADCCPPRLRAILDDPTDPDAAAAVDFQQYVLAASFG